MNPSPVRPARLDDLPGLLRLYRLLQPDDPVLDPASPAVQEHWRRLLDHPGLVCLAAEVGDVIVSSCILSVIPNLSRGMRPYALIENVITDPEYRRKHYGTRILEAALQAAWSRGCYKVMLLTGRKEEHVFRFYEQAGFKRRVKTGFVAYPAPTLVGTLASRP